MALTSSKTVYRAGFSPLMPGVFIAPYPYCLHCKVQWQYDSGGAHMGAGAGYPVCGLPRLA